MPDLQEQFYLGGLRSSCVNHSVHSGCTTAVLTSDSAAIFQHYNLRSTTTICGSGLASFQLAVLPKSSCCPLLSNHHSGVKDYKMPTRTPSKYRPTMKYSEQRWRSAPCSQLDLIMLHFIGNESLLYSEVSAPLLPLPSEIARRVAMC